MVDDATTWSPAEAMLNTAKKDAACPEDSSMAAVPPSRAHSRAATASLVGFWSRV